MNNCTECTVPVPVCNEVVSYRYTKEDIIRITCFNRIIARCPRTDIAVIHSKVHTHGSHSCMEVRWEASQREKEQADKGPTKDGHPPATNHRGAFSTHIFMAAQVAAPQGEEWKQKLALPPKDTRIRTEVRPFLPNEDA